MVSRGRDRGDRIVSSWKCLKARTAFRFRKKGTSPSRQIFRYGAPKRRRSISVCGRGRRPVEIADMTRLDQMRKRALTPWLFVLIAPLAAAAQDATPTSNQNTQGPMIVERVKSGFLVAPDFKVTEVDHKT